MKSQPTQSSGELEATPLTSQQLDAFAAECALSAAVVFALHNWTWETAWGDESEPYVPGAAALMKHIRQQLDRVELNTSLSSGRVGVSRFIQDGAQVVEAWLDLGSVEAEVSR